MYFCCNYYFNPGMDWNLWTVFFPCRLGLNLVCCSHSRNSSERCQSQLLHHLMPVHPSQSVSSDSGLWLSDVCMPLGVMVALCSGFSAGLARSSHELTIHAKEQKNFTEWSGQLGNWLTQGIASVYWIVNNIEQSSSSNSFKITWHSLLSALRKFQWRTKWTQLVLLIR